MFIIAIYSNTTKELSLGSDHDFINLVGSMISDLKDFRLLEALRKQKNLSTKKFTSILQDYDYKVEIKRV